MVLAEPFAGTAALTLHMLGGRPLTAYLGGKQRYAKAIAAASGLARPTGVILNDAGPWGRAWITLTAGRWVEVAAMIEALAEGASGAELFQRLAMQASPSDDVAWTATFLMLQSAAARGKPVADASTRWRTAGYAHLSDSARRRGFVERLRPDLLAARVRALGALDWPPVTAYQLDVTSGALHQLVDVVPDVVYLDPSYKGTTGYQHDITRGALRRSAEAWRETGALVVISEAEPLSWAGWHHHRSQRVRASKRIAIGAAFGDRSLR
ncbi:MAG: hypothetical protein EKK55_22635 [Rhodocyclaceae bacterium]|nr:MAG: hypothetical protein EKK55_22635 [Rhodocyclaceae bacterium]